MDKQELNYANFSRLEVKYAIELEIDRFDSYNVSLIVENYSVKDVTFTQEGDKLTVGRRRLSIKGWFAGPLARIKVKVRMPELAELRLSGASHGTVRGFSTDQVVALACSGASSLTLESISAGSMLFDLSGASHALGQITVELAEFRVRGASSVELSGSAQRLSVDASGASRLELRALRAANAEIKLQGASYGVVTDIPA